MPEPTDEESEFLANYDPTAFPPVAVTVDIVVMTIRHGRLSVLLVQRADHPFKGAWAFPGGFVDPDEDLGAAAVRELTEECGAAVASDAHLEQLGTYGDPQRDPRMRVVSVAYLAFVPGAPDPVAGSDARAARFWDLDDISSVNGEGVPLAFDHADVLEAARDRVSAKLEYTTLATAFCVTPFSLGELRHVYEAVWGMALDPANFRRKVLASTGFVVESGETCTGRPGRPAALYRPGGRLFLDRPVRRSAMEDDDEL